MARQIPSTAGLGTKQNRLSMKPGSPSVEEKLSKGRTLGYRRATKGGNGTWYARMRDPETGKRVMCELGTADDYSDADGRDILTHADAQRRAMEWFDKTLAMLRSEEFGEDVRQNASFTVAEAMDAYFAAGARRGMKGLEAAKSAAAAWILPALGGVAVSRLSRRRIEAWLDGIASSPRRVRPKTGHGPAFAAPPASDDEKRARKDTANRILTILKAALTFALDRRLTKVDPCWQMVKPFRGTTSARIRFLQAEEQARLVNVCPPDFKDLVRGALLTGCRYGELVRLRCRDYNPRGQVPTVFIAESKSGKPRHIVLTSEGVALFDELTAKRSDPNELVFQCSAQRRSRGNGDSAWLESDQRRFMLRACKAAGLEDVSFHELRHTYASALVNNKCPLPVVAQQLGHTDSRMVEKHYGHLVPGYVADMVRAAMPTLGIVEPAKVQKLRIGGA